MKILIFESETPEVIAASGGSQTDNFAANLRRIEPAIETPVAEPYRQPFDGGELDGVDAAVFPGAGVAFSVDAPEAAPLRAAMTAVFARGLPCFGSCNGMQLAALLLGGRIETREPETGIARGIELTAAGRRHPMMAGRSPVFAAPTIHGDQVVELPAAAVHLAGNAHCAVQAFAVLSGGADFWGVEYHPEFSIGDIGRHMRRQGDRFTALRPLIDDLLVAETDAAAAARLGSSPAELTPPVRDTELRNWIAYLRSRPSAQ